MDNAEARAKSFEDDILSMMAENKRLQERIHQLENKSLRYEHHVNNYQDQVKEFATFKANKTCLDPIIFWSGYAAAILIGKSFIKYVYVYDSPKNKKFTLRNTENVNICV